MEDAEIIRQVLAGHHGILRREMGFPMDAIKAFFRQQAQYLLEEVWEVARQIGEHPELGYQ